MNEVSVSKASDLHTNSNNETYFLLVTFRDITYLLHTFSDILNKSQHLFIP